MTERREAGHSVEVSNRMPTDLIAVVPKAEYILRLYVAGSTLLSSRAITNLTTICEAHLKGRYDLTVVDLYVQQARAHDDQIVVAPTLVRQSPLPVRRMIGDLAQTDRVLAVLGLPAAAPQR